MSEKVLLIDDDARLVGALQIRLERAGYEVQTAENGDQGLSLAALFQPDAIILDIRMPKMDGFEVCQIMRTVPELVDVPIIILSASGETGTQKAILDAGGKLFLRKPYHLPQLLSILREVIDGRARTKCPA
ncbi:MAG TPA: response regulator [Tepidisphaeraceae bacterium]|nr:response regulator [Tepidisphaeraceae bacterium]